MKTRLHAYYFDTRKPDEATAYANLKAMLKARGSKCVETWGEGSHYFTFKELDGETLTLEPPFFSNQWNTGPTSNSKNGWRVFDWAQDYPVNFDKAIKRGHYLDLTSEMQEARRNTVACGYCGKQEPAQKGYVFCPYCLDSEYLKESDLPLTRMQSIDTKDNRTPLTAAEREYLLPLYREAQLHGSTKRGIARLKKQRQDIEAKYQRETKTAKAEHDGLLWLLDHGVKIDNVIYYSHTERFCFGWLNPLDEAIKSALLDILVEFPFEYEIKSTPTVKL